MLEVIDDRRHQTAIEVVASEGVVAGVGEDFELLVFDVQDRDVKGAPAEVENRQPSAVGSAETVGQRGRRGLIQEPKNFEAGQASCILGRLTLALIEKSGHRNDGLLHRFIKERFGMLLQRFEQQGAELLGTVASSLDLYACVAVGGRHDLKGRGLFQRHDIGVCRLAPHQALHAKYRTCRVGDGLACGCRSDENLLVVKKCNHGRKGRLTVRGKYRCGTLALYYAEAAVRGAKIDSNRRRHTQLAD